MRQALYDQIDNLDAEVRGLRAELSAIKAQEPVAAIPDGYSLVPSRIELSPQDIACIMLMCGGDEEATEVDEQFNGGVLWVGNIVGDEGELTHGLHIACVECMEEGSTTIAEFNAPVSEATIASLVDALRLDAEALGLSVEVVPVDTPAHEAKACGVVMPERKTKADYGVYIDEFADEAAAIYNAALDAFARLNAAPAQQVGMPDGWKLVPMEPTHEMLGAALMTQVECLDAIEVIRTDYKAMLAAAPPAPAADAGLVADAERWRFYAPKVAALVGMTMDRMTAEIDEANRAKGVV